MRPLLSVPRCLGVCGLQWCFWVPSLLVGTYLPHRFRPGKIPPCWHLIRSCLCFHLVQIVVHNAVIQSSLLGGNPSMICERKAPKLSAVRSSVPPPKQSPSPSAPHPVMHKCVGSTATTPSSLATWAVPRCLNVPPPHDLLSSAGSLGIRAAGGIGKG